MDVRVFPSPRELGQAAAERAAAAIREAAASRGRARVIAATGASQFAFLDALTASSGLDWSKVELFHLDEYIGVAETHPASFRRYLKERLVDRVKPAEFHALAGDAPDLAAVCREVGDRAAPRRPWTWRSSGSGRTATSPSTTRRPTSRPTSRTSWSSSTRRAGGSSSARAGSRRLDDVPRRAISMSIRQILKAREILCVVPDARKARPCATASAGPVSVDHPASALQNHGNTTVFLDRDSAALL